MEKVDFFQNEPDEWEKRKRQDEVIASFKEKLKSLFYPMTVNLFCCFERKRQLKKSTLRSWRRGKESSKQ